MGATFPRLKNWGEEILTNADLNAEIDNILNNLTPSGMDDYSTNVAQMQTKTDPGEVGSESLATSIAAELERLRFCIGEIKGTDQWYESSSTSLDEIASVLGGGLEANRISSGRSSANSSQPLYLVPAGAGNGRTVDLKGASTNLIYSVEGISTTISTDVSSGTLLAAPSSNNTALVNDGLMSDQEYSKNLGEYGTEINIDTVGSEITSLLNEWAGFKINNGSTDEYFLAYVKDSTTLSKVKRGYFFDDSDVGLQRVAIANNDTITLMKLTWVFANAAGAIVVTYNNPRVSADEPTSPAVGDYWFDTVNDKWKTFNSSVYVDADATFAGVCIQDDTDTVGARSTEFFKDHDAHNTVEVVAEGVAEVRGKKAGAELKVYGSTVKYKQDLPRWNMSSDLIPSEGADTTYYFYVKENGDVAIDEMMPMDRREDLKGLYHPFETWRCLGQASNDASQNFEAEISYHDESQQTFAVSSSISGSALTFKVHGSPVHKLKHRTDSADPSGEYAYSSLVSPQEFTVDSGATLGHQDTIAEPIYLYALMNGSNPELAVATHNVDPGGLHTSTAMSGSADDEDLFSTNVLTDVPAVELARGTSTQTTAGTYAADLDEIALYPFTKPTRYITTAASGSATTTVTTYAAIANQSVTMHCTGKPVRIEMFGEGDSSYLETQDNGASGGASSYWQVLEDAVVLSRRRYEFSNVTSATFRVLPDAVKGTSLAPTVGSHTYAIQHRNGTTGEITVSSNVKFRIWEVQDA